ncbi:iron transporter [Candidatus Falkowbacteria bacterium RIFCSPLOWO2_02_FULL_45_15]|uniref:Iron transporter n=1 Tax=Candidatus Falkowbacteria bacterium RIFCSPLOWO2_02_FULL_45_15 TaxID=1797988 RepID=A0A1F5S028_9BACT|nr:MAG: iron transporter [Candidatus Falkowbacteria bacterium RIFCSPLOWO2_02_FULL_45_15]
MKKKLKKFFRSLGPGFITGASDDDPSGIATYSQTGALFGYGQLWLSLYLWPFMSAIQEMCGRIGLVTGRGLAGVIRAHYHRSILYVAVSLLLIANTVNIGADLGAMASAAQLLLNWPFASWLIVMIALTLLLEVFVSYRVYAKYLKYLTLALFAYVAAFFMVRQDWRAIVLATFIPKFSLSSDYLMNIVAILGTTISPYLFFWQASEEVEEEVTKHKIRAMGSGIPRVTRRDISALRSDTAIGMLWSQIIAFFIIATTGSTLYLAGMNNITTATEAAEALRPLAGNFTFLLFALGIVGTGLLAVPVLAGSASYAIAESFGWREGLYRKFAQAHGFYGVITVATLVGLLINFIGLQPFQILYYTAVLNGMIAPPLMVLILLIAGNKKIMGKYINSRRSKALGWIITVLMGAASLALLYDFIW